jgi:hypothetical protein
MNVNPLPPILIAATGAPLAQAKGTEVDRAAQDATQHDRQVQTDAKAEAAAGIGTTEEQSASSDRDADGRRLWEAPLNGKQKQPPTEDETDPRTSRDATGHCGTQLDLSG